MSIHTELQRMSVWHLMWLGLAVVTFAFNVSLVLLWIVIGRWDLVLVNVMGAVLLAVSATLLYDTLRNQ